ncbi:tRNA ligase [Ascobolus immersus RN42]|uniref:tRNA ligase n=1 Tax=Ascobolus immersus RN42 TaxID=1160509 RepID=A0A3N4IEU4_ASCIM|nr:tRNA ligase [Ascobolus immersus RN42]
MSPFEPQDPQKVNDLIGLLSNHQKKGRGDFVCRKNTFDVIGSELKVDSWKFNDFDYKKKTLPVEARGFFTCRDPRTGNYQIATRGYDKFFNINEIQRTKWDWIESHTKAPYELTVKENGCIIFISGLPDDTLLVCSKHSTGPRGDQDASHAMVGEKWIDRQLATLGKTRQDLARTLREMNATAVAELCDDSFEEHILEYTGDRAGLYLHGINLNLLKFTTYDGESVHKFADAWGFKKVDVLVKNDVKSLRQFLEKCAESGSYDGIDVEGFVIRCKARYGPSDPEWHDWFFKYKFEEPYLMYRQWREVTKAVLSGRQPKYRKHAKITKEYLTFAGKYFNENKTAAAAYQKNHGIIALRDAFMRSRGTTGSQIIKEEAASGEEVPLQKLVLVPVASIGCGKTTLAVALAKLFNWGHVQNDNIVGTKGRPQKFAGLISSGLMGSNVVIADRNNHQKRERGQIINDVSKVQPDVGFVALQYVHGRSESERAKIEKITQERVFNRGDNHQTIRAGTQDQAQIIGIMRGFLDRFQPVDTESEEDSGFDSVIDLDVECDSRINLETVVTQLHEKYPQLVPVVPSDQELDNAISAALNEYKPDVHHTIGGASHQAKQAEKRAEKKKNGQQQQQQPKKQREPIVEYIAIKLPTQPILKVLVEAFEDKTEDVAGFYKKLKNTGRIQESFHITLMHKASSSQKPKLWESYVEKARATGPTLDGLLGNAKITLDKVVWDGRVMTILASILGSDWESANKFAHITIGTADKSIKPVESNALLTKWSQGGQESIQSLELPKLEIEGEVRPVLSR